jgi:hypothetical protein
MTELSAGEVPAAPDARLKMAAVRPDEDGPLAAGAFLYEGDMVTHDGKLNVRAYLQVVQRRTMQQLAAYLREGHTVDWQTVLREQMRFTNYTVEALMESRGARRGKTP